MNTTEIKPCPFCGGKAELRIRRFGKETKEYFAVYCRYHFLDHWGADKEAVISNWNQRTEPDRTEEILKAIKELSDRFANIPIIYVQNPWQQTTTYPFTPPFNPFGSGADNGGITWSTKTTNKEE